MAFELLRETHWFKIWRTSEPGDGGGGGGPVLDSKLRWFGVEPDAARFVADFAAADAVGRDELEEVFIFFPYELQAEISQVLDAVRQIDAPCAGRMAARLFTADSELTAEQKRFISALKEHLYATGAPMTCIGENRWFAVDLNDAGLHIDTRVESILLMPSAAELATLVAPAGNLAYARAIKLVQENPWLIEPPAGAEPLPGLTALHLDEE
jgi:hypothetical protein